MALLSETAGAEPGSTALDPVLFQSLQEMLDAETLCQIYRELLEQTRARLPGLAAAETHRAVADLAHGIRGTCAMMGAVALAQIAAALEAAPVPGLPALQAAEQMKAACAALEAALDQRQVLL